MKSARSFSRRAAGVIAAGCFAALAALSQSASAEVLGYQSIDSPSLAVFNGRLFMAYTGTDSNMRLNYAVTSDGVNFSQVTDGSNSSAGGPAIAVFNGLMYVAFPGTDHKLNIAHSSDGQHYSGQFQIPYYTPWRPAMAAGGGTLYLAYLDGGGTLHVLTSTDGQNFSQHGAIIPSSDGFGGTNTVYRPATLAAPNSTTTPQLVYTLDHRTQNSPDQWCILQSTANISGNVSAPDVCGGCDSYYSSQGGVPQGGIGYLNGATLVAHEGVPGNGGQVYLDVNSTCSQYGSFGTSGVAPAAVGFNGHAYIAYTGTDSAKHINFVEAY